MEKRITKMFILQIKWNREFHYQDYTIVESVKLGKKLGDSLQNSGDGASVKGYRIIDNEGKIIYPKPSFKEHSKYPELYTCSFCDKQEYGKPLSWLKPPISTHLDHKLALMPEEWDWDIVPVKFTDSWSCGCHKFDRSY